jgi:hypothetical protein
LLPCLLVEFFLGGVVLAFELGALHLLG